MITSLILFTVLLSSRSFEQKFNGTLSLSEDQLKNMKKLPDILDKIVQESSENSKKLSTSLGKIVETLSQNLKKVSDSLGKIVENQQTNNPPEEKPESKTSKPETPTTGK